MTRLKETFHSKIVPQLQQELSLKNVYQVPRVEKVIVSMGLGEVVSNPKAIEHATRAISLITGQKPLITRAKKAISNFKIKKGNQIGLKVTLRARYMYEFLDRLINAVLPRIRDFRGVPLCAFDGKGNYNLGIKEDIVFPELVFDEIDRPRGLQITIVTSAKNDTQGKALLSALGFPLRDLKEEKK